MRIALKTIILIITICRFVSAQNVTISGFITDSTNGEKLIGAGIYDYHSKKGTASNNYGYYSVTLPASDSASIIVSYIGYRSYKCQIKLRNDKKFNFSLLPGLELPEVLIKGNDIAADKRPEIGVTSIPVKQIRALPALGGESDIMRALQLMPGIKSGNEGTSGLYVRGGSPDQNLILLDDVPLYYVNHIGGFVSIFNTDAINTVKLIRGGFPAHYSSRLSSIVDIRMKEGDIKKFHVNGMLGLISSKLSVEGPFKKDVASYIVSFRRTLLDLITRPLSKQILEGVGIGYNFYDLNAKIYHKASSQDQLYYSFYMGDDKILSHLKKKGVNKIKLNNDVKWGNLLGAVRWNHIWSKNLFSNLTCAYTRYRYAIDILSSEENVNNDVSETRNKFDSRISDINGKLDFEYYLSPVHSFRFGTNIIYHTFKPGVFSYYQSSSNSATLDSIFNNISIPAWESSLYAEYELKTGRFQSNAGFRISDYEVNKQRYFSVEPRVLVSFLVLENMSVKASFASMQQNIHLLTSYNLGLPTDLWVPATDNIAPSRSTIYSAGIKYSLFKNLFELNLEGYYKDLSRLIAYKEGASFLGNTDSWETKIETGGKGKSYGAELLLEKKEGRTTGWIGYTLSKTTRQFENLNNGKPYNYTYDRRHEISLVFMHKFNEKIDVSASWVFSTGNAITLPAEKYYVSDEMGGLTEIHVYNGINTFRMRSYHKLDIGINFHKKKKWGERVWSVSIYNVYNRKNPYYYYFSISTEGYWKNNIYYETPRPALMQQSLFPIIPSVSYSFRF
jgi:hypothetical protein